jgi:hypothetical protein
MCRVALVHTSWVVHKVHIRTAILGYVSHMRMDVSCASVTLKRWSHLMRAGMTPTGSGASHSCSGMRPAT